MRNQTTTIWGAIGKDAVTQTINGKNYAKFSLAVDEGKDKTAWYNCLKHDENGKLSPHITKGKGLILSGFLKVSAFINKDKEAQVNSTLWVNELEFFGGKKQSQQIVDDDDLPFN